MLQDFAHHQAEHRQHIWSRPEIKFPMKFDIDDNSFDTDKAICCSVSSLYTFGHITGGDVKGSIATVK